MVTTVPSGLRILNIPAPPKKHFKLFALSVQETAVLPWSERGKAIEGL